jgi:HEAT repeats
MKLARTTIPILFLAGAWPLAVAAQTPVPRPARAPAAPAPAATPAPSPAPALAPAAPLPPEPPDFDVPEPPEPPLPPDFSDLNDRMADLQGRIAGRIAEQQARVMERQASRIADQFALVPQRIAGRLRYLADDNLYNAGQRALDDHRYAEALEDFSEVASRGGTRADGALYWKAYTLIKLGRRDEARAATADLGKTYPHSRWLDDAKVLEVQAGKPVSPESESDEQLKLIALNGLMQSDPDRALPLLENLLKGNQPPTIKKRVVYVLAFSDSLKAQQLLEQVARGGEGNPDLQLVAIRYLGERRNQPARSQLLLEIYNGSSDAAIKRAVLAAFASNRDRDHLLQIAKGEKDQDLRLYAIRLLGSISGAQDALWQLYQSEPSVEVKQQILESIPSTGNLDRLLEVAKTEKDPKLRRFAIQALGSTRAAATGDSLVALYSGVQDQEVKRTIVDALCGQRNVKALIQVARAEKDPRMKQRIVERLAGMRSPEATDYLMEILK